jgi:hypothetical protein
MPMRCLLLLASGMLAVNGAAYPAPPKTALQPADGLPAVQVPTGQTLERQLLARDQGLFDLQYAPTCHVAAMRDFVTADMEFYHDEEGFAVDSGDQWAADYGRLCAARNTRGEQMRRELVSTSALISRIPNYGAVMTGEQRFFRRTPSGQERFVATSRFSKLWRLGPDGVWRLARSFSFEHRKVP